MIGNKEIFVEHDENINNQVILEDRIAEQNQEKGVTILNTKVSH